MKKKKTKTKRKAKPPAKKKKARQAPKKKSRKARQEPAAPTLLSSADMAKRLNISVRQLMTYRERGCPCVQRRAKGQRGGKPKLFFNPPAVSAWFAAEGITQRKVPDEAPARQDMPTPAEAGKLDPDLKKSGLVGALARLRWLERVTYSAFVRSMHRNELPTLVRAKEKLYLEAHEELRKTEKETPGILEHRGEAIPLETVLQEQARIDAAIKIALLGLPRKLALELSTIDDPAKIEEVLQAQIDEALENIATGKILEEQDAEAGAPDEKKEPEEKKTND